MLVHFHLIYDINLTAELPDLFSRFSKSSGIGDLRDNKFLVSIVDYCVCRYNSL